MGPVVISYRLYSLVFLGILTLSGIASAQNENLICNESRTLTAQARSLFKIYQGIFDSDADEYESPIVFAGANQCGVSSDASSIECRWSFTSQNGLSAASLYEQHVIDLRRCFPPPIREREYHDDRRGSKTMTFEDKRDGVEISTKLLPHLNRHTGEVTLNIFMKVARR